jgi:hypothetical protein
VEEEMATHGNVLQKTLKETFVKPARETLEMKRAFLNGSLRE